MEQLLAYLTKYGLSTAIIALSVVCFIGLLKVCKVFSKISSAQVRKTLLYGLSVSLSFGGVALYFVIMSLTWETYIPLCITQVSATTALYAIYENLGIRKLLQVIAGKVIEYIKKHPERKTAKALKSLGLTDEMLTKLQAIANNQSQTTTTSSTTIYPRTQR